ncbi:MAG: tetratricopeptide repeat protein [Hyphomicrobiales bacterium]
MEAGFAFDRAGKEEKAVEFYNKALKTGIPEENLRDVYFCLASSYRNIAKIAAARRVLPVAKKKFPQEAMFDIMRALIDCDQGRERKALFGLLELIAVHLTQSSLDP